MCQGHRASLIRPWVFWGAFPLSALRWSLWLACVTTGWSIGLFVTVGSCCQRRRHPSPHAVFGLRAGPGGFTFVGVALKRCD